jgi:SsrA-binding protein
MKIFNKRAKFNYILDEKFEAGIVLSGDEVKAFRHGAVDITHSFGKITENEAYLINANFAVEKDQTRPRKLLMHKKEIISIDIKIKAKKLTFVPTKMYTKHGNIKVELALGKGKKKFEKKESIKRADIERNAEKELRGEKDNKNRI